MKYSNTFLILLFIVIGITIQCASQETEKPKTGKSQKMAQLDPCEILSEELIKAHFDTDTAKINREHSKYSPHPLCTITWRKKNADEIEAAYGEQMQQYLKEKMAGKDVKIPISNANMIVNLTLNKERAESKEAALANFDSAMGILRDGMTVKVGDIEHETKKRALFPIDNIGDKAMWVPSLHQLSVVAKNQIFHVGVEEGGETFEKEKSIALAKEIIKVL